MAPAAPDPRGPSTLGRALSLIHTADVSTRAELTGRLGLSRSAIGAVLDELAGSGLVAVNTRPTAVAVGRPSHRIAPHPDGPDVVAVHVELDRLTAARIGLGGTVRQQVERVLPRRSTPAAVLDLAARAVARLVRGDGRRCLGVGVAVPSAVSDRDGVALAALRLDWPAGTAVRDLLAARLDTAGPRLPVAVGNDANLAALAEHRHGAGRGARHLLYLTTGQRGVGGGLVVDGRPHTGSEGYALEVGHLTVRPGGRACHCGNRGCLDVEADVTALLSAVGRVPAARPTRSELDIATGVIASAGRAAATAAGAVAAVTEALATGVGSLLNVLNPDRLVLGGLHAALLTAGAADFAARLAAASFIDRAAHIPVLAGRLARPELAGAAEIALQPLLDAPHRWPAVAADRGGARPE